MRINLSTNGIKNFYLGTDLHVAAINGDLVEVERILAEHPEQYKQITRSERGGWDYVRLSCSRATALHYALIQQWYSIAERLLQHTDCPIIINIANSAGASILNLIVLLPDREQALNLAKLALDIKGIQVNNVNSNLFSSPLYHASEMGNLEMVRLLLDRGADPNVVGGIHVRESLLNHLAEKLTHTDDIAKINSLNAMILLLIDRGADPKRFGQSGATFFDDVIGKKDIESKLDPKIKERLQDIWKISSAEEITKAKEIYWALQPFAPDTGESFQSPSLEDTALLVNLKKERKRAKRSDYDCTVLYDREHRFIYQICKTTL
ncbi:ankyrin repeat domain-containing protein [Legionella fallonii]|uniref:Uncharacterized protein n=1 Tax=Legionella fallonii LLAP-10 TaxID=1212491 RepID=A0A098G8Z6_9GAMM|nr:ankyrin repeat domain-containing protein [Legionella fallonii]CEG58469.1 protein of unknown function [ankyrin repeat] [Legionella fallonii LLAP-10]